MKNDFIITEKRTLSRQDEIVTMTHRKLLFLGQISNLESYNGNRVIKGLSPNQLDRKDIGMENDNDEDSIAMDVIGLPELNSETDHSSDSTLDAGDIIPDTSCEMKQNSPNFLAFRLSYLFVTLVVMLADGLQGM
jgi:hypothetical protein